MPFPTYPKEYNDIIRDIRGKAKENGVKIKFRHVTRPTAAYFDSEKKIIYIPRFPDHSWIKILIHESCHLDQMIEYPVWFNKMIENYSEFYVWLDKNKELPKSVSKKYLKNVIDIELDCEKRSIEKIKKYQLPIDIQSYKQDANIYLYTLSYAASIRNSKIILDLPDDKDISSNTPKVFRSNYEKLPEKLDILFRKYLK